MRSPFVFFFEKRVKHVSQMVGLVLNLSKCFGAASCFLFFGASWPDQGNRSECGIVRVGCVPQTFDGQPPKLHRLWMSFIMSQFIQVFHMCLSVGGVRVCVPSSTGPHQGFQSDCPKYLYIFTLQKGRYRGVYVFIKYELNNNINTKY